MLRMYLDDEIGMKALYPRPETSQTNLLPAILKPCNTCDMLTAVLERGTDSLVRYVFDAGFLYWRRNRRECLRHAAWPLASPFPVPVKVPPNDNSFFGRCKLANKIGMLHKHLLFHLHENPRIVYCSSFFFFIHSSHSEIRMMCLQINSQGSTILRSTCGEIIYCEVGSCWD